MNDRPGKRGLEAPSAPDHAAGGAGYPVTHASSLALLRDDPVAERGTVLVAVNGNSRCSLWEMRHGEVLASLVLDHASWRDGSVVRAWLHSRSAAGGVVLCSVVPELSRVTDAWCMAEFGEIPLHVDARLECGMRVAYHPPETLGADRLCAVLGAQAIAGSPVIAVDFGTAVTVNVVDAGGVFTGGVILPGAEASALALHWRTAKLPHVGAAPVRSPASGTSATDDTVDGAELFRVRGKLIGGDTDSAIALGITEILWRGVHAYVEAVRADLYRTTDSDNRGGAEVIVTGGGAEAFLRRAVERGVELPHWRHDPALVPRGAEVFFRRVRDGGLHSAGGLC